MNINIKKLNHFKELSVPKKMSRFSCGFDFYAAIDSNIKIQPSERYLIDTGLCFEIENGYEMQIRPRSGLSYKYGITVLNSPGTIDSDYRGEIKVLLINLGKTNYIIKRGDRIAQGVISSVINNYNFKIVNDLSKTTRNNNGLGSTGI